MTKDDYHKLKINDILIGTSSPTISRIHSEGWSWKIIDIDKKENNDLFITIEFLTGQVDGRELRIGEEGNRTFNVNTLPVSEWFTHFDICNIDNRTDFGKFINNIYEIIKTGGVVQ